jgi:hypothetical protein
MKSGDVPWTMEEGELDLASLTSTECRQVTTMLRETMMPRLTAARHRELAEEAAKRFERRALTQASVSRG